jgi:hypothetical protein
MAGTIHGGCLCGHIRYEYTGVVGPANYCHCEDCRRCTGSAFNIGVRIKLAEFRIVSGSPRGFTKRGESGTELTRHFCPECGSPIFTSSPKHPNYVYVKAGSLDEVLIVKPTHQNWVVSAVPWSQIGGDMASFTKGPE